MPEGGGAEANAPAKRATMTPAATPAARASAKASANRNRELPAFIRIWRLQSVQHPLDCIAVGAGGDTGVRQAEAAAVLDPWGTRLFARGQTLPFRGSSDAPNDWRRLRRALPDPRQADDEDRRRES